MFRLFGIGITLILMVQSGFCSEADWKLLNKKANEIYKGIDVKISLNLMNIEEDGDIKAGSKVGFEIPLLARDEREKKRLAKIKFLQEGAEIIKEIEEAEEILKVNNEKIEVLKKSLLNEGYDGVEKYFDLKVELVKIKALLRQKRREFEALCGKK